MNVWMKFSELCAFIFYFICKLVKANGLYRHWKEFLKNTKIHLQFGAYSSTNQQQQKTTDD